MSVKFKQKKHENTLQDEKHMAKVVSLWPTTAQDQNSKISRKLHFFYIYPYLSCSSCSTDCII